MITGVYRSIGLRASNEDSLALEQVQTTSGECVLMVVCDGIASLDHGEIVSGYVTECMVKWFYSSAIYANPLMRHKISRSLHGTIYDAHHNLLNAASRHGLRFGTTCTMMCLWNRHYVCMHLGDSAAYRISSAKNSGPNTLKQLTSPHVDNHKRLIRCVGSLGYYSPDISFGHLSGGDSLLIATDGFTDMLSTQEIAEGLYLSGNITSERIERRLYKLGRENERRGAKDNRSAICLYT